MGAAAVSTRTRRSPRGRSAAKPRKRSATARRVAQPSRRTRTRAATRSSRARAGTSRRARITPPGGVAMLPVAAVGGAAGAVGGIADSGVVVGLTRGRLWIALLGVLLGGIVAVNVWGLSLSASTSGAAAKIDELERAISVQRARIAKRSASDRIQALAAARGFAAPAPKAVRYVAFAPADAGAAAQRLASGEISVLAALPIAPELAEPAMPSEPAAEAPVAETAPAADPAAEPVTAAEPAAPEPATPAAPAAAPTPTSTPQPAGGGISP
jgi:hypothetical protein